MSKTVTELTREAAIALFVALGFKSATKWSDDRLVTKLSQVATKIDTDEELEDADAQATLNEVLEASQAGNDFAITGAAPAKKAAKKAPAKKAAKKAPAKTADKKAVDAKEIGKRAGSDRPAPGTNTGKVWDICDKLQKKYTEKGKTCPRKEIVAACVEAGLNKSTAGVQFGKWCAANGLDPKNV